MAFALRLYNLGAQSLWYDETISVFLARQSIPELIAHTARDIHPPGYYLLLHLWGWLTEPALENGLEFVYAWPSLFWGLLLLPLVFALGRRFFSTRVAMAALWLTAVNPYHIWYSQEVRMYTLGAGLGLLCLWGTVRRWQVAGDASAIRHSPFAIRHSPFAIRHSLFIYILAAAAGLYTLYYFAFLLITLNLLVFWQHFAVRRSPFAVRQSLRPWLLANTAAFLLWSPWLPVFWRQMTDPPVPPWRVPLDVPVVLQESLAALLVGQSPPMGMLWPWALVAFLTVGLALAYSLPSGKGSSRFAQVQPACDPFPEGANVPSSSGRFPESNPESNLPTVRSGIRLLFAFIFLPLLLIIGISLTLTPLYHIRYFVTYAAASALLIAFALDRIVGRWRWLHAISLVGLVALSGWSLSEFWTNPLYRADDHRAAVTELAQNWRPGDAVLVNAGWAYTALAVYWPVTPSPSGAQPAHPPLRIRLYDYANNNELATPAEETPVFLLGGSIDGPDTLGWGLAASDFYPISTDESVAALAEAAARHPRIWHYRLYDTVSDPDGAVRDWLDSHTTPRLDLPYPGRDFLRVQLFETPAFANPENCPQTPGTAVTFGDGIILRGASYSPAPQAGSTLYATLCWEVREGTAAQNLRTSLRLYGLAGEEGAEGVLLAQKDESPFFSMTTRNYYRTALALPIPAATPPGEYRLEVIVYDGTTGDPLPIDNPRAIVGQRWPLAETIKIQ